MSFFLPENIGTTPPWGSGITKLSIQYELARSRCCHLRSHPHLAVIRWNRNHPNHAIHKKKLYVNTSDHMFLFNHPVHHMKVMDSVVVISHHHGSCSSKMIFFIIKNVINITNQHHHHGPMVVAYHITSSLSPASKG